MAAEAAGDFFGARCPDESSDSEPEQEPGTPQKLIRKVSTSGQIRSKVSAAARHRRKRQMSTSATTSPSPSVCGGGGDDNCAGARLVC